MIRQQANELESNYVSTRLRKGMIVGMGNSLLDLIGHVDDNVLSKYKLIANNCYLAQEEHMPIFKELLEQYNAKYVVGGSVQNSFRVTQWVLGVPEVCIIFGGIGCDEQGKVLVSKARADGVDTQYQYIEDTPTGVPEVCIIFGGIGCDEQGKVLVSKARADGVDTQYQYIEDTPTGICAALLTKRGAERTLVANLSAASCFTIDHLMNAENQLRLQSADIIYISGFFLTVNAESVLYAAKSASERNTCFAMNLSGCYVAEQYMEKWCEVMPYVDILFGNDLEARTFAKEQQFDDLHDVLKIALELSCLLRTTPTQQRIVVITQGRNPVVVVENGMVKEYPVKQVSPEKVVDSTGAGDAFVGGFLAQFVQDVPLDECIECGIWCASQMIQQQGCSLEGLVKYTPSRQS